jgi:hypothetical protein
MTPLQNAARFAAFVWYTNSRKAPRRVVEKEASRFAREHWQAFLPVANEGLGRLLLQIAKPRKPRHRTTVPTSHRSARHAPALEPALIA